MQTSDDKNRIEDLKETLYSRNAPDVRSRRKLRFSPTESKVQTQWERPPEEDNSVELNKKYENHSMSFFAKILLGSFIFCIIAVGIGAFLFFKGANFISGDNIEIVIRGPVSIPGGAPVSFDINVNNKNNTDLQLADLLVEFPAGTTDPNDPTIELKNYRILIGDIPAGQSAVKTIKAIMYGEENIQRQIEVSVTYKVKGSSSLFTKRTSYDVLINSSPILLSVSSFEEITSGQEFNMKVSLKSNSSDTLKNVLLKASYPFGFTYISSNIKPLADNLTWRIGDIPAGAEKIVSIQGKIQGEDSEVRVIRFTAGAQNSKNTNEIGTQYMVTEQSVTVKKPFVSLAIAIDSDDTGSEHVGQFNKHQRVTIKWFNNLPTAISNMSITAKLSGSAYNKNSVQPENGYFNSATNEITWNRQTNNDFASIGAGEQGSLSFGIVPYDNSSPTNPIVNPTVTINASVSGSRTQGSALPEKLSSLVEKTSRIVSNATLTGRVVRNVGPFVNTGPIPPKVEVPSSYTIIWTVDNTSSTLGNAQVTATLPAQIKWLDIVSPSTEKVSYDKNSGLITWDIGNVSTYTLNSSRRREVNFQVSIQPSVNQIGTIPTLLNQAILTATDSFTGSNLESVQESMTTRFSTDPDYKEGQGTVVR